MNDDSIATHMYCHVLSVLLTGQKKKRKKKKKRSIILDEYHLYGSISSGFDEGPPSEKLNVLWLGSCQVKSSQVTFIYIVLLTIQIVSKQLSNIKIGK